MHRTAYILIPLFLSLLSTTACTNDISTLTPKEAILEIEKHPFSRTAITNAIQALDKALKKNPNDVWANIGAAEVYLRTGYKIGSRFKKDNYVPEALDKAYAYAQRAVKLAPDNSRGHALLAKLQIIRGEYKTAWQTLNRAHDLDPDSFYPWYYLIVLNRYYRLYDKAKHYADRAESLAQYPHQRKWVIRQRLKIADSLDDVEAEERGYLQIIEMEPDSPHAYGNYATFLYYQKRYREAVAYFEKAINIGAYPKAIEMLEKSRQRLKEESLK